MKTETTGSCSSSGIGSRVIFGLGDLSFWRGGEDSQSLRLSRALRRSIYSIVSCWDYFFWTSRFLAFKSFLATLKALLSSIAIVAFLEKPLMAFYNLISGLFLTFWSSSLLSTEFWLVREGDIGLMSSFVMPLGRGLEVWICRGDFMPLRIPVGISVGDLRPSGDLLLSCL